MAGGAAVCRLGTCGGRRQCRAQGSFATCVFEGPYGRAREWQEGLVDYARSIGREVSDVYFFYTTCPTCAKHYGRNYVIVLGRLA